MAALRYYFATISPYTYLAGRRLEEIADKHGLEIDYRPVDLLALFARTGGVPPGERHPSRQDYRAQDLVRRADLLNMPLNLRPAYFPANAAPSSYAVIAAQNAGGGDLAGLIHGFTRACWAEEKNVADDAVIRDALQSNGFDPSLADSGLLTGAETYSRNLETAVEDGAFGAPFYITPDGQKFWGTDRLDDLDAWLSRGK